MVEVRVHEEEACDALHRGETEDQEEPGGEEQISAARNPRRGCSAVALRGWR
eukprot:CAMPEP_0115508868 /NCGR_PEP_ID=MMETSP0271-20121206/72535_1 /TAXON_ID=71861 /ORGANISM="Scrippsiella trochoidea, Strain CCMP3099" /LENGTH=51 /DNA_ID=CAMNT_0002938647 /DNA_START=346 /DNA_END=501 /DNA_ORIENTATION=-